MSFSPRPTCGNASPIWPNNRRRGGFPVTVIVALLANTSSQATISAPPTATWGGTEAHGGTLAQRALVRAETAQLPGKPFAADGDALRALCAAIRKRIARSDAQCGVIFSNSGQAHYLVEIPTEFPTPASATPAPSAGGYALPGFLTNLHDRFDQAYATHLRSLRPERYEIRDGRVHFGIRALDRVSAALAEAVPTNTAAILHILANADNPEQRAHAGFLLGWTRTPEDALRKSLFAFDDPDAAVRNNYSMMAALVAPAVSASLQEQLVMHWCEAIAQPVFTDRSKALLGLSRIRPALRRALPDQCKEIIGSIGRETALAEIRRMATIVAPTPPSGRP